MTETNRVIHLTMKKRIRNEWLILLLLMVGMLAMSIYLGVPILSSTHWMIAIACCLAGGLRLLVIATSIASHNLEIKNGRVLLNGYKAKLTLGRHVLTRNVLVVVSSSGQFEYALRLAKSMVNDADWQQLITMSKRPGHNQEHDVRMRASSPSIGRCPSCHKNIFFAKKELEQEGLVCPYCHDVIRTHRRVTVSLVLLGAVFGYAIIWHQPTLQVWLGISSNVWYQLGAWAIFWSAYGSILYFWGYERCASVDSSVE